MSERESSRVKMKKKKKKKVGGSALFVTRFYTKPRKRDRSKKGF